MGVCDGPADAREALATAKAETDAEFPAVPQVFLERRGVGCLRTVNRLGAFVAWTRGRYYFSAHAKGGERDLDEFMEAFPYLTGRILLHPTGPAGKLSGGSKSPRRPGG